MSKNTEIKKAPINIASINHLVSHRDATEPDVVPSDDEQIADDDAPATTIKQTKSINMFNISQKSSSRNNTH